jgi:hypothetical protein
LIKPCSSGKKHGQAKARMSGTSEHSSRVSGRKLEGDTAGFRNRHQFEMEQNSGLDKVHDKKRTSNGIHLEERVGGVSIDESMYDVVGGLDTREPRKGMYTAREQFVTTNASGLAKHRRPRVDSDSCVQSADFAFRSLSELQSALFSDLGVQGDAPAIDKRTGNKILQDGEFAIFLNKSFIPCISNGFRWTCVPLCIVVEFKDLHLRHFWRHRSVNSGEQWPAHWYCTHVTLVVIDSSMPLIEDLLLHWWAFVLNVTFDLDASLCLLKGRSCPFIFCLPYVCCYCCKTFKDMHSEVVLIDIKILAEEFQGEEGWLRMRHGMV